MMVCYLVWGVGQVGRPLWYIESMTGVSVQDNADKRFHIKALPVRRRAQGPPGWGRHGAAGGGADATGDDAGS